MRKALVAAYGCGISREAPRAEHAGADDGSDCELVGEGPNGGAPCKCDRTYE